MDNDLPVAPPNIYVEPKPSNNKLKVLIAAAVVLSVFVLAATGYLLFYLKNKKPTVPSPNSVPTKTVNYTYFINCDDPRQVIDENNLLYVACLGGVLVVDKDTGEVKDQIGMPDGLGNSTATSLIKIDSKLYIGSQDGITVFDLATRKAQKISVGEGLVNGANIELFRDGDNIWAATFNGVSLLDTTTGKITNYTSELDKSSQEQDIANMLVTQKYVYFLEIGSVYSNGAVIRYDKSTKTFKTFGPDAFGQTGQYGRVDFSSVASSGSRVFVSESNQIFSIDENGDDTWKKITSPYDFVKKDSGLSYLSAVNVLPNSDSKGVLFTANNKIYRYIPETDVSETVYDFGKDYKSPLFRNEGDKMWLRGSPGTEAWLSNLDLIALKVTDYKLAGRPAYFGQMIAMIDNKPLFETVDGVFEYDLTSNVFNKLLPGNAAFIENYTEPAFVPVPGTSQIFILRQACGQGCEKPVVQIYDYSTAETTDIAFSDNVTSQISNKVMGGINYDALDLVWRDLPNGDIGFENFNYGQTNPVKYFVFNVSSKSWRVVSETPKDAVTLQNSDSVFCNRVYSFADNGNQFSADDCNGKAENENFSWIIKDNKVKEFSKITNTTKDLNPPALPAVYSPFGTVSDPKLKAVSYIDGKLWIETDRGLVSYDPVNSLYKLYGTSDGLLSGQIYNLLIDKNIWVNTGSGGFSVLNF